jgi:hypothetical protein
MTKPGPCPWCARPGSECWVLPCLALQQALDTEDDSAMIRFARAVRVAIAHRGKTLFTPAGWLR